MPITVHQIGTRGVGGGSTVATGAGTSVGGSGNHGLLLTSFDPGVNPPASQTDSKGNVMSLIGTTLSDASHGKIAAYLAENWSGGSSHASGTMTFTGSAYAVAFLLEVRGAASSSPLDKDVNGSAGTMPVSVASGVLAQAAEAVIAIAACNVYSGVGAGYSSTNLTILDSEPDVSSYWTSGVGYVITAATTSVTYDMRRASPATTGGGIIRLLSFKEAAGGGGGSSILRQMMAHH